MSNKRDKKFYLSVIALSIIMLISSVAFAGSSVLKQLLVDYDAVKKVVVDGVEKKPSDDSKPFVAEGSAYIPLQFVEDALRKDVDFDSKTGIITIDSLPKTLNVWSFTDEVPKIVEKYKELHPNFDIDIKSTIVQTMDNAYQQALDIALAAGGAGTPDIYSVESAFAQKYTQGEAAKYAAPYKDFGIDVDRLLKEAEIAQYTIDIGIRPSDKQIVGLTYQGTGSACIYRRSVAKNVWGTDNPQIIKNKIGPGWDQFFKAAAQLKAKGYGIVSGDGDVWRAIEGGSPTGWIVDGKLNIDPSREKFLDYARQIKIRGWSNNTQDWTEPWFADMYDGNEQQIFCYFGPAWFVNYVTTNFCTDRSGAGEGTYGDWAICEPPENFFWGGTWILGNKDTKHKDSAGSIIEWITLDSSKTGLQYLWANGISFEEYSVFPDTVPSGTVMKNSNGRLDILNGQDMFDVFACVSESVSGKNKTEYDEIINSYWRDVVWQYANGKITRADALAQFKKTVAENLGIK